MTILSILPGLSSQSPWWIFSFLLVPSACVMTFPSTWLDIETNFPIFWQTSHVHYWRNPHVWCFNHAKSTFLADSNCTTVKSIDCLCWEINFTGNSQWVSLKIWSLRIKWALIMFPNGHNWCIPMFFTLQVWSFQPSNSERTGGPWGFKLFLLSTSHPGLATAEFVTVSRRWFRDIKFGTLSNLKRWIINHTEHTCTRAYYIRIYIYTHTYHTY